MQWSGNTSAAAGTASNAWTRVPPCKTATPLAGRLSHATCQLASGHGKHPHLQQAACSKSGQADSFRYWHEDRRFKGTWFMVDDTLRRLGGLRMGGNTKSDPTAGQLGWQAMESWDLLWSPSTTAAKAAEMGLRPEQLTSAVPGSRCLTRKKSLVTTLTQAYRDDAFDLIPLTFELPSQTQEWLQHMGQDHLLKAKAPPAADEQSQPRTNSEGQQRRGSRALSNVSPPDTLWILKTALHLGKGMVICPQQRAIKEVVMRQQAVLKASPEEKKKLKPFVVAQRYIHNPMLIHGCKFGLRVWVVITSVDPYRVYLHQGGLVLFSSHAYNLAAPSDLQSHLTNYAQNVDGRVWTMSQLEGHLGRDQYARLVEQVTDVTARVFAAAAPHLCQECARLKVPQGTVCELFGLDYLIDNDLKAWLLEVNATPSMAADHADPDVQQLILREKQTMLDDMFRLLDVPARFAAQPAVPGAPAATTSTLSQTSQDVSAEAPAELARAGGWRPLMCRTPQVDMHKQPALPASV